MRLARAAARLMSAGQDIPRGELVPRLVCALVATAGLATAAVPWDRLQDAGRVAANTGAICLLLAIASWHRRSGERHGLPGRIGRAERERIARLQLPGDIGQGRVTDEPRG